MTTLQRFADSTYPGELRCNSATYLTARSGGGTFAQSGSTGSIAGQELFSGNYYCYETFWAFDTSALGASAVISSVVLSIWHNSKLVTSSAFVARARLYDWGTTLTTADWVPGANLASNTLLAHIASGGITAGAYNNWTDDAFPANINKTGTTRIVIGSDRLEAGNTPSSGQEYTNMENASHAGTTFDPYLTITYTIPAGRSQAVVMAFRRFWPGWGRRPSGVLVPA